eukprot:TRINITY_DN42803_c0_g2_i1.p1 TRINITY_DN42803_c0_g2~~TRINITY_DN42803_c0_g2_i1.p1  ORF type:complete len:391 (+),score=63.50 TRINITY_DN42803_c0_g2_i1:122-1174(+)
MPRQGARRKAANKRKQPTQCTDDHPNEVPTGGKRKRLGQETTLDEGLAAAAKRRATAGKQDAHATAARVEADFEAALEEPGDTAEKLFELANKACVGLTVGGHKIVVQQDNTATEHSGGVVWETSYFLARYLEQHVLQDLALQERQQLRVVEIGAGCGLLGLALARLGCQVVLTEQPSALANLKANAMAQMSSPKYEKSGGGQVTVKRLSWGDAKDIAKVCRKGPFDLIVATDVVFTEGLVDPLLQSIQALFGPPFAKSQPGYKGPACWVCVQQRDPDAHQALIQQAPKLFRVRELSFAGLPGFEAAEELECFLFRYRPRKQSPAQGVAEGEEEPAAAADELCTQRRKKH